MSENKDFLDDWFDDCVHAQDADDYMNLLNQARKGYLKVEDALKIIEDQKFKEEEDEVQYVANAQLERVKKKIKKLEVRYE